MWFVCSNVETFMHLMKGSIGTGILFLSRALKLSGLLVISHLLTYITLMWIQFLCIFISAWCNWYYVVSFSSCSSNVCPCLLFTCSVLSVSDFVANDSASKLGWVYHVLWVQDWEIGFRLWKCCIWGIVAIFRDCSRSLQVYPLGAAFVGCSDVLLYQLNWGLI